MVQDKLPKDSLSLMTLRNKLDELPQNKKDEIAQNLPLLNLKSPQKVFWLGSFLFGNLGVGRFMIGDIGLGVGRLLLFLAMLIVPIIFMGFESEDLAAIGVTVGAILYLAVMIWFVVDLFLTGKKLRKNNLNELLQVVSGSNLRLVSIMERMPKNPLQLKELQDKIAAFDEKRQNELITNIDEETASPFKMVILFLVIGFFVLLLGYFAIYDWLDFKIKSKISILYLAAVGVWVFCIFKGQSLFRETNYERANEIIDEKEKSAKSDSNLVAAAVGAVAGAATAANAATSQQKQAQNNATKTQKKSKKDKKDDEGEEDDELAQNEEVDDSDGEGGDGLLSSIFDDD